MTGDALVGALAGGALLLLGHRRGGALGAAAELVGAGLAVAALAPPIERWLLSSGSARRRMVVHCTLRVDRPVDDVFEFFRDFENFTHVLRGVESITDFQDGRSHWAVRTGAGRVLEWNATVTKYVPRSVIAWHSVGGSEVDTGGIIRFAPTEGGGTRIELELAYRPCATDLREAVHALLDMTPARQVEADLARIPAYIAAQPEPAPRADEPEDAGPPLAATSPVTPGAAMPRGVESGGPGTPSA